MIVKGSKLKPSDNCPNQWRSEIAFCQGLLARMISHSSGISFFSSDPVVRSSFEIQYFDPTAGSIITLASIVKDA